jgi:hypothetical protein
VGVLHIKSTPPARRSSCRRDGEDGARRPTGEGREREGAPAVGAGGVGQDSVAGERHQASRAADGKGWREARTSVEKAAADPKPPPEMADAEVESRIVRSCERPTDH